MRLGATYRHDRRTTFVVWAPKAERVELVRYDDAGAETATAELEARPHGYFAAVLDDAGPGTRYRYRLHRDGQEPIDRADPASRWQPDGVLGPSAVVDDDFDWSDRAWGGLPLRAHVIYELHVGTFTTDGTFDGVIDHLDDLIDLGVTAIELMPVAQFSGGRNWGYDGVLPYAAQDTYGGPDGLRRLVDACHARGLAVVLDVVYNHFGPEGSVFDDFGHYFTDRYGTPWGRAINFDDEHSDEVRRYVVENALWWVEACHIDALRLDAVHAILDQSAMHILEELTLAVHDVGDRHNRRVHVIAESDLNDPRLVRPTEVGGYGMDAQWVDDFHHALHALLTGETAGYYSDFGSLATLADAMAQAYVFQGQHSTYRGRRHGAPATRVPGQRFVIATQNHDQVGNRMLGERLTALVDFESVKLAAAAMLLSPFVPMLFMGEEYGETAPFLYFVSHGDPDLVEAVRRGRAEEFAAFAWAGEPPDPQAESTFEASRLDHALAEKGHHAILRRFYQQLLTWRRDIPALARLDVDATEVVSDDEREILTIRRWSDPATPGQPRSEVQALFNFCDAPGESLVADGVWRVLMDSADDEWGGPGAVVAGEVATLGDGVHELLLAPRSVVVLLREDTTPWG